MSKRYDFYNHSDGSRVRVPAGKIGPASLVREVYRAHVQDINDSHALRATLRFGKYTSLGCYPIFWITSDGGALCYDCVHSNYRQVSQAIRERSRDGWRVDACTVNWEDADLWCEHCNERVESAYAEPEQE